MNTLAQAILGGLIGGLSALALIQLLRYLTRPKN